jgi:uncharacterized membrane protein required for colicin V production
MNWLDLVIVVAIAWFTFSAFWSGVIREVVTIIGVALGIVLAGLFYEDLADDVELIIDTDNAPPIIAFLLILGACATGQLARASPKQTASLLILGTLDHLFGAIPACSRDRRRRILILFVTFPALGLRTRSMSRCSVVNSMAYRSSSESCRRNLTLQ